MNRYISALPIIRSKNSLFNADFTNSPRTLPDGTVYATDKSLKYTVRSYLRNHGEDPVFAWERINDEGESMSRGDIHRTILEELGELPNEGMESIDKVDAMVNLMRCIDVRLFGVTYSVDDNNFSLTGPTQISYGIDRLTDDMTPSFRNQIDAPFTDGSGDGSKNSDDSDGKGSTTLGSEQKAREVHYVFDMTVNPNALADQLAAYEQAWDDHDGLFEDHPVDPESPLTDREINQLKEALCFGVTELDSTTMIGSENELLLWLESDEPFYAQNLKEFVSVERPDEADRDDPRRLVVLDRLEEYLDASDMTPGDFVALEVYHKPGKIEPSFATDRWADAFNVQSIPMVPDKLAV